MSCPTMPDPIDFVPERVFPPLTRPARAARLSHAIGDGLAALLLNAVVVACLAAIGWPISTAPRVPDAISVELVDKMPGAPTSSDAKPGAAAQAGTPPAVKTPVRPASESADATPESAATLPETPDPEPPAPQQEQKPPPQAATPAPLDHPSDDPKPRIVAAPPDPHETPTSLEPHPSPAPAPADPPKPVTAPPPAERPKILAAPDATDQASPQREQTEPQKPEPTAEEKRQAENTAKLAAALPFAQSVMADPFRASVTGSGSVSADQYRGAVYAAFRKADAILAEAQAKNLRGQAVIAFRIDDSGALVQAGVAVSSGNAEIDRLALAIIQHSTPYPPPPPGAPHAFSPAIRFGADQ